MGCSTINLTLCRPIKCICLAVLDALWVELVWTDHPVRMLTVRGLGVQRNAGVAEGARIETRRWRARLDASREHLLLNINLSSPYKTYVIDIETESNQS
ncbi:hypothetical protein BDV41DRAFT_551321 [Aspergillus transmontanensis]|uniref:Uncharacterized protein n=1 Tax=Aspergillus transmontanensis TaxID=1034304 RepID=A0A5N6VJK1_9EURO|nr:hypothetical protein BDV41DRAFT_551321 [Aspergillus transmontanensis]